MVEFAVACCRSLSWLNALLRAAVPSLPPPLGPTLRAFPFLPRAPTTAAPMLHALLPCHSTMSWFCLNARIALTDQSRSRGPEMCRGAPAGFTLLPRADRVILFPILPGLFYHSAGFTFLPPADRLVLLSRLLSLRNIPQTLWPAQS
ncbi:hypothetical protein M422DRAFT_265344 [Sphaerobolus stellatus SS14]|uniref:Uncharacterized protein n=1 Tax=Sphaerobolus stellatus (strain SS14) TaxID=990650 RepID=A0A0C9V5U4_SPHS4|nr:hypothetical protein M422DRAFT_265344 [Sphaerobolus stellatus SS14]